MSGYLPFPPILALVSYLNIFLVTGPVMLAVTVVAIWKWRRKGYQYRPKSLAGILIFALIMVGHLSGAYLCVRNALAFRLIALDRVRVLEVEALSDQDTVRPGVLLRIQDAASIRHGLMLLSDAEAHHPNHEHFVDGYRIRIVAVSGAEFRTYYLSMFCGTSREASAAIVVPHPGVSSQGTTMHGGEYDARRFTTWLTSLLRATDPSHVYPRCL